MSKKYTAGQYSPPNGSIVDALPNSGVIAYFRGTPTASVAGHLPGALAFDITNGLWYRNTGTISSATWTLQYGAGTDLALLTATATELNYLDQDLATNVLTRGAGVDTSAGYSGSIARNGLIVTRIYIDLETLVGSATDLDIIGESAAASCTWGQITTAKSGTIVGGKVTCLEVPTGGSADIDFYSAAESTGAQDALITSLDEVALVTAAGAWTAAAPTKSMTGLPRANDYIYVVNGAASGGTFTAGKFLIELFGT